MAFKVWIDQDLCTGDGLCTEIVPDIFQMHSDGLAYVKDVDMSDIYDGTQEPGEPKYKMSKGLADVPDTYLQETIEAAEECPGECIFIEEV